MKKAVVFFGVIAFTLGCAGAARQVHVAPNNLRASRDSVATAFTQQLTLWGFTTTEHDSGEVRIVTGSIQLPRGQKLAGHPFGYWADCGKMLALSQAYTADEMRVQIHAAVRPHDGQLQTEDPMQSQAGAVAFFTGMDRQAIGDPTIGCTSRGLLEQQLLNAGHTRSQDPYKRLTPDGTYTLSPRPGDSLSAPVADDPGLAHPASLKTCEWDSLEQPYLDAKGEVAYTVTAEGIPDTATLSVRSLFRADTAAFQNAARRLVAKCRFYPRTLVTGEPPGQVRQRLFFGATEVLTKSYGAGQAFMTNEPGDSAIVAGATKTAMIFCPAPEGLPPGRVELEFVVGLNGKPEPGTIHAVNATSPELARMAPAVVTDCRFTVAHWKGRPVRSLIRLPLTIRAR